MKEEKIANPIDALFDENNIEPIVLFNEKGEEVKFEQVAIIPLDKFVYAILKPIAKVEGIEDDEALVFKIVEDDESVDESYLNLVDDIDIIDKVFDEYDKLFEAEKKKKKK